MLVRGQPQGLVRTRLAIQQGLRGAFLAALHEENVVAG
jgi:hypothetical protein